jgi:hypothetical protein
MIFSPATNRFGLLAEFIFIPLALRVWPANLPLGGVEPYSLVVLRSDPS